MRWAAIVRRLSPRVVLLVTVVLAAWLVVTTWLVPALIRSAYLGQSTFAPLNQLINGQADHPVGFYLSLWQRAVVVLSALALVAVALAGVAWRSRVALGSLAARTIRREPVVSTGDTVRIGAWFGFAGGLVEASSMLVRFALKSDPREAPSLDALWMAPLSAALLGALAGLLLAVALRAGKGLSIGIPVALFSSVALYPVVIGLRLGVHKYAVMLLCVGVAVALVRRATLHGERFRTFFRQSTPWLAPVIVLGAAIIRGSEFVRERSAMAAAGQAPSDSPNVLLLILDTVRAQELGLYGYDRNTSPRIDHFAATGVTFERAISPAPWTLPSHASMFTGRPPHALSTDFDQALDASAPTLAEVLSKRGYATGGFVANLVFATHASGLDRGFGAYRDHPVSVRSLLASSRWLQRLTESIRSALGQHGELVRKTAAEVNREFLDWMPDYQTPATGTPGDVKPGDRKPFFAFLNYFDAHHPYELHPPFDRRFSKRSPRFWLLEGWKRGYPPDQVQEFQDAYDSAIAYLDQQVGALLDTLKARGVLEHTIVILVSDHGEHLGDHGGIFSHANSLYLPLLHVPLVISYPSRVPADVRIAQPVSTQNLAATVLDMVGASSNTALPGELPGQLLPGQSLAGLWRSAAESATAATAAPTADSAILSELTFNTFAHKLDPIQKGPMQSVVRGTMHYIRNGDRSEEVYDWAVDPGEVHNLAQGEQGVLLLTTLRRSLDALLPVGGLAQRAGNGSAVTRPRKRR